MENLDRETTSKDKKEILISAYKKLGDFLDISNELLALFEEMKDCNEIYCK